jgi:hypothetical protein
MLSKLIVSHTYSILEQKIDPPIILNWKSGGRIIYEEQAIGDQEQKEDKLPSKQARRLPTTRHNDFLWLDINTNHQK